MIWSGVNARKTRNVEAPAPKSERMNRRDFEKVKAFNQRLNHEFKARGPWRGVFDWWEHSIDLLEDFKRENGILNPASISIVFRKSAELSLEEDKKEALGPLWERFNILIDELDPDLIDGRFYFEAFHGFQAFEGSQVPDDFWSFIEKNFENINKKEFDTVGIAHIFYGLQGFMATELPSDFLRTLRIRVFEFPPHSFSDRHISMCLYGLWKYRDHDEIYELIEFFFKEYESRFLSRNLKSEEEIVSAVTMRQNYSLYGFKSRLNEAQLQWFRDQAELSRVDLPEEKALIADFVEALGLEEASNTTVETNVYVGGFEADLRLIVSGKEQGQEIIFNLEFDGEHHNTPKGRRHDRRRDWHFEHERETTVVRMENYEAKKHIKAKDKKGFLALLIREKARFDARRAKRVIV